MTRQREAFPKLDLVAFEAAFIHLRAPVCMFMLGNRMIGQLFISEVQKKSCIVNYLFAADHIRSGEFSEAIRTRDVPNQLDEWRRSFLCPGCGASKRDLYYVDSWSCASCHKLLYRSQLVDKEVKLWEERDQLHSMLRKGRPKGMHNGTYMSHRLRLAELERRLNGRPRKYASDEHDAIVTQTWVPASDSDLWSSTYTVRVGEFVRIDA